MAASTRSGRLLKLGAAAGALATAGGVSVYMRDSPWWSSLAPVRFGRAAIAVSNEKSPLTILLPNLWCFLAQVVIVSADYKWSLRNLEYGAQQYRSTMKEVSPTYLTESCSLDCLK